MTQAMASGISTSPSGVRRSGFPVTDKVASPIGVASHRLQETQ
jgi:hypothetical protein